MGYLSPFLITLIVVFSPFTFSMTLGDVTAATAIQNTLNSTAAPSYGKVLDKVKTDLKKAEEVERKKQAELKDLNLHPESTTKPLAEDRNNIQSGDSLDFKNDPHLENLSRNELDERFDDGGVEINVDKIMDYTKKTVIFYKGNCENKDGRTPSSTCSPMPVLTNIKSVIFNYAHKRGEFKKK